MRCPICRKPAPYEGNPFRPFCSERCQLLDLDNWLSERNRIPTPVESVEKAASPLATREEAAGPSRKGGRG